MKKNKKTITWIIFFYWGMDEILEEKNESNKHLYIFCEEDLKNK
jgi:hypothetical protein